MKALVCLVVVSVLMPSLALGQNNEVAYLQERMLPAVRDFIRRNQLAYDPDFPTNRIRHYRVEFAPEIDAVFSRMMLEKKYAFLLSEKAKVCEIWSFQDTETRPFRDYSNVTPEEREVILSRTNVLNKQSVLALAAKHFKLQGHREENFHPPEFWQHVLGEKNPDPATHLPLPLYEATWYRKDVKLEERNSLGFAGMPNVLIIVSGLNSNLVYYSKVAMPVGRDSDEVQKKESP
ncbi:MAG: hypothetical protein HW389_3795 [Bacteroidetes bacterium]|nr:hypothetical protein [Bacteroidota bacterium]